MRRAQGIAALGFVAMPFSLLPIATAQEPDPGTAAAESEADQSNEAEARMLFDNGRGHIERAEYDLAIAAFERALSFEVRSATRVNLAVALALSGRLRDAVRELEQALSSDEQLSDGQRKDIERRIDEARAAMGRLLVRVAGASEAEIRIDGDLYGTVTVGRPAAFFVDPGTHTVEARAQDASGATIATLSREVDVGLGAEVPVDLEVSRPNAAGVNPTNEPDPRLPAPSPVTKTADPVTEMTEDDGDDSVLFLGAIGGLVLVAGLALTVILVTSSGGDEPEIADRVVTLVTF